MNKSQSDGIIRPADGHRKSVIQLQNIQCLKWKCTFIVNKDIRRNKSAKHSFGCKDDI